MELSVYQKKILDYFKANPNSNMYINAKAGSGKTFIATQMLKDVQDRSLYVAFNKSIAEEMKTKITNPKIQINTIHSLCYGVLNYNIEQENKKTFVKSNGKLDNFKIHKIVEDICSKDNSKKYNYELKEFLKENYVQLYNLVRLKYIKLNSSDEEIDYDLKKIVEDHQLFFSSENPEFNCPYSELNKYIKRIDYLSIKQFEEERIYDFTDMLYITLKKFQSKEWQMPGWNFYKNIVVDEAQDLSTIQLYLLKYFKKKEGRYVFLLDPNQAIYGFAGSNSHSYKLIKQWFAPIEEFDLPINYRCPYSHLDYVNKKFKIGIMPRPNAPQGNIIEIAKNEVVNKIQVGDYLIGRKNKWLMPMIIELVKKGKPIYIKDIALVENIKKTIKKQKAITVDDLNRKIKEKENKLQKKINQIKAAGDNTQEAKETINNNSLEVFNMLKILIKAFKENHNNMRMDIFDKWVDNLLNTEYSKNCVFVTSIHCVKGLEAPNCFVLNRGEPTISGANGFMTKEQREQEQNLSYVALTRSQDKLYLVSADGEEYGE